MVKDITEIPIPINLTYCEAELVRGAIYAASINYTPDDRRVLRCVHERIHDQIFQAEIKFINSAPVTDTLYGDHPDFLEIV